MDPAEDHEKCGPNRPTAESSCNNAAHFPLDPRKRVSDQIPGYSKNMNAGLAKRTTLLDLAGTDLGDFLEYAARLAGN